MNARTVIAKAIPCNIVYGREQAANDILMALTAAHLSVFGPTKFAIGQRVTKIRGSSWTGKVVGFYSTSLTPMGYAVESENEPGSVQIYPEAAIESAERGHDNA